MDRIFISYRRDDAGGYAGTLYRDLRREFGSQVFQDVERSLPGDRFQTRIRASLARCDVVVVVIGPGWLSRDEHGVRRLDDPDDLLRIEIALALQRHEIAVLPVLVGGAHLPRKSDLPEELQPLLDITTYRLDEGPQREGHLAFLIHAIGQHVDARTAIPAALAALLAMAVLLWPVREASKSLLWPLWESPEQLGSAEALVRLGVFHAAVWMLLSAAVGASAAVVARGGRGARRAALLGALAGAAGGFVGGAIDQLLRAQEARDLGLIAGITVTAAIAATGGLLGRATAGAVLAAGLGAFAGSLLSLLGDDQFWDYALPVIGMVAGLVVVRLVEASSAGTLRAGSRRAQTRFGAAREGHRSTIHR